MESVYRLLMGGADFADGGSSKSSPIRAPQQVSSCFAEALTSGLARPFGVLRC